MDATHTVVADDSVPRRAKTIAQVDVFAGLERGVKAADFDECVAAHGKVPTAQPVHIVNSTLVRSKSIVGALHPIPVGWWDARRAAGSDLTCREHAGGSGHPCLVYDMIRVDKGQHVSMCRGRRSVPQFGDTTSRQAQHGG